MHKLILSFKFLEAFMAFLNRLSGLCVVGNLMY